MTNQFRGQQPELRSRIERESNDNGKQTVNNTKASGEELGRRGKCMMKTSYDPFRNKEKGKEPQDHGTGFHSRHRKGLKKKPARDGETHQEPTPPGSHNKAAEVKERYRLR